MTLCPLSIAALLSVFALTACGKTGELQQPAPLFGAKAKADYDADQQAKAAREKAVKEAEPQATPPDPSNQPLTQAPYAAPIPGNSSPFDPPPQGALPNPGTASDR